MTYQYRAYTIDKKIVQGMIDAASESSAEEALYQAGYENILSLKEVRPRASLEQLIPTLFGVKTQDVIDFSQQLATLVESGIPILTALQLLQEQTTRAAFRSIIAGLAEELRGGVTLSQALGKYPQVFSYTYCQVIRASEQAGSLEVGLKQVATLMEKQAAAKRKLKSAMAYPAMVLAMAIGVFILLVTVALPPLVGLFTSLGADLPFMTRMAVVVGGFLINYKLHLLGGVLALVVLIVGYTRLPQGRLLLDGLILKIPVLGPINIQRNMCHFCQTTSMMLSAGLHLPQILDIASQTIENRVVRRGLADVREKLVQGQGLSQPMAASNLFPPLLVQMVVVGETTGTLDSTFTTVANFYERRVDQGIQKLISIIEPTLIVIVGLVVAFIALSMITPLYSMLKAMY